MRKLACLLFVTCAITACGKKGPLIYPDMLVPAAPSDLSLQQSGTAIKLSFVLPSKDLAGRNISGVSGVRIVKRDEASGHDPGCSACTSDFSLFRLLNLDPLSPGVQRIGSRLLLLDSDVRPGRSYAYRIKTVTNEGVEGAESALRTVNLVPAPLPPVLQAISQPTEIQLEFVGLKPEIGVMSGYNVYRSVKGEMIPLLPLNRDLLTGNRFVDVGLERGTIYVYGVRSVVQLPSGEKVEGLLSNEVEGKLKDDE